MSEDEMLQSAVEGLTKQLGLPPGRIKGIVQIPQEEVDDEVQFVTFVWNAKKRDCLIAGANPSSKNSIVEASINFPGPSICLQVPGDHPDSRLSEWLAFEYDVIGAENAEQIRSISTKIQKFVAQREKEKERKKSKCQPFQILTTASSPKLGTESGS